MSSKGSREWLSIHRLSAEERQFTNGQVEVIVRDGADIVATMVVQPGVASPKGRVRRYKVDVNTRESSQGMTDSYRQHNLRASTPGPNHERR